MSWRNRVLSTAASAALTLTVAGTALAQNGPVALVVGNGNYENYADLRTSVEDAENIASKLASTGYDVTLVTDANAEAMRAALGAFLATGDSPSYRLFYYSGHSANVDGETHLVPADASVTTGLDLAFNFIPMAAVTDQMNRDATPDIVIMDTGYRHFADNELANVLPGVSVTDAPASPEDDNDILTVLAVSPNSNNIPQTNRRNVFSNILGNRLTREDQDVRRFFNSLTNRVGNQSNNRQEPYVSAGFSADVVMNAAPVAPEPVGPTAREERLWALIAGSSEVQDYQDYLTFFPEGYYSDEARNAIAALTEPQQPETPTYQLDPINQPFYIVRLSNVRNGPSTDFQRLATLPENTIINNLGKVRGTRWFQILMPDNTVGFIFETLVAPYSGSELQAWAIADSEGTISSYQNYLNTHPQGPNAETAANNIAILQEQAYQDALAAYRIRDINEDIVLVRRANIRSLPTTRSQVVATLEGGTRLTANGDVQNLTWTRLNLNGSPAFLYDTLFVPYVGSVYEAWDQANEADSVLGYIRFRNRFPNSEFDTQALQNLQALQAAQNTGFNPIGEQYVVSRASNIFSEPSRQSAKLLEVRPGKVYQALRETDNGLWVEIRVSRGQVGYIRSGRVQPYAGSVFEAWALAEAEGSIAAYRDFRNEFPGSRFDDNAATAIDDLLANQNTMQPINETIFLPSRAFVYSQADTAAPRLGVLAANSLIPAIGKGGSPEFYKIQTNSGEGFVLTSAAEPYIGSEREAWDKARRSNTVEAVNAYLAAYPNGIWLQQAIQLRTQLAPSQQGYQFNLGGLNIKLVPSN